MPLSVNCERRSGNGYAGALACAKRSHHHRGVPSKGVWGRAGVGGAATLEVPRGKGAVRVIGYTPLEPNVRQEDKQNQEQNSIAEPTILSLPLY